MALWPNFSKIWFNFSKDSMYIWKECVICSLGLRLLYMAIRLSLQIILFKLFISLLIFCLLVLSVTEKNVYKIPHYDCRLWGKPNDLTQISGKYRMRKCKEKFWKEWYKLFLLGSDTSIFFFNEFIYLLFIYFICLFLAALGLRCCVQAFSSCGEQGLLFAAVPGLLIAVASLVAEQGL